MPSCDCDFCSGRKTRDDNWCSYCATVKMAPPKWWENMDLCDACEELRREDPERFWGGRTPSTQVSSAELTKTEVPTAEVK